MAARRACRQSLPSPCNRQNSQDRGNGSPIAYGRARSITAPLSRPFPKSDRMSSSQPEPRQVSRWISHLPRLRVVVGAALVLTAVGFGVHSGMNRQVEVIDDSELQVLDDLVAGENLEPSPSQPRPLATATITDVVPAVHQHPANDEGGVQLAGHATDARPESQPPVWLSGTIEDSGPAVGTGQKTTPSQFRRLNR